MLGTETAESEAAAEGRWLNLCGPKGLHRPLKGIPAMGHAHPVWPLVDDIWLEKEERLGAFRVLFHCSTLSPRTVV